MVIVLVYNKKRVCVMVLRFVDFLLHCCCFFYFLVIIVNNVFVVALF